MARVKLSEHTSKSLLYPIFNLTYHGVSLTPPFTPTHIKHLASSLLQDEVVLKVDQGVKKRGKKGLIKLNPTLDKIAPTLSKWHQQGYSQFLLEPLIPHQQNQEHYLALELTRSGLPAQAGWQLSYSPLGGIEIESHWDSVKLATLPLIPTASDLPSFLPSALRNHLLNLLAQMTTFHLPFLEINPLVIQPNQVIPLDLAVEIDDAALSLSSLASSHLTPVISHTQSQVEKSIAVLDSSTPASLKFKLINPQGKIWMLLSGGGASLVLADEVADLGLGKELANYGEYSGAPSEDDTYAYTRTILQQLLKSKARGNKALIIAGGVANFTDVNKTFRGLIRALQDFETALVKAGVKVFVRRGGPNEEQGLANMRQFLTSHHLLGTLYGHSTPLTRVIKDVKKYLYKK